MHAMLNLRDETNISNYWKKEEANNNNSNTERFE